MVVRLPNCENPLDALKSQRTLLKALDKNPGWVVILASAPRIVPPQKIHQEHLAGHPTPIAPIGPCEACGRIGRSP
jgi:hypothetical protein